MAPKGTTHPPGIKKEKLKTRITRGGFSGQIGYRRCIRGHPPPRSSPFSTGPPRQPPRWPSPGYRNRRRLPAAWQPTNKDGTTGGNGQGREQEDTHRWGGGGGGRRRRSGVAGRRAGCRQIKLIARLYVGRVSVCTIVIACMRGVRSGK